MDTNEIKIISNYHKIPVIYWYELTEREKKEFDYLDSEERQENATFFRYRGNVYDMGEFMRIERGFNTYFDKWDGYISDSYFSGIVIRYYRDDLGHIDSDFIQAGLYLS